MSSVRPLPSPFRLLSVGALLLLCAVAATACTGPLGPGTSRAQAAPLQLPDVAGTVLYARQGELWLRSGSSDRQFTRSGGLAMQPAWSPNGKQIAYVLRRKNSSDIALMQANGLGTHFITDNASPVVDNNLWAFEPTWSPDGKTFAYLTDRGRAGTGVIDLAVWTMNTAGGQLLELQKPAPYSGGDADPAWRPGHPGEILYSHYFYTANGEQALSQLILLDTRSQRWVAVTPPTESDFQAAWTPHGRAIVFVKRAPNQDNLVTMSVATWPTVDHFAAEKLLLAGVLAQPVVSHDGKQLLYIAKTSDQGFDLSLVGLTGSGATLALARNAKPQMLTDSHVVDATSRPSWQP